MNEATSNLDREQLAFDESLLERLKMRRDDLSQRHAAASAAVAEAQVALKALSDELDAVSARHDNLSSLVAERRGRLQVCYMASLLPELLRAIFTTTTKDYQVRTSAKHGSCDYHRARQPFQLAAVSKWWRQIALDTPKL